MDIRESRRGFLFTVAAIILIVPLVYLISFYGTISDTQMDDTVGRIRCDELHYFVEDTRRDMERAVSIFGRRAALSAIDDIVTTQTPLKDYKFQCDSARCNVDCSTFEYPENGSEAAIAELIICGTLHGNPVEKMENNTLSNWTARMSEEGRLMGFEVDITPAGIKIVPRDPWHFAIIADNKVNASDRMGLCYFSQNIVTAASNTSIIGLEDPLYLLKNFEKKTILNCSIENALPNTPAGCGTSGSKTGGGFAILYANNVTPSSMASYRSYCDGGPNVPAKGDPSKQVFLLNQPQGTLCSNMKECFNASKPKHFAAVISYDALDLIGCDVSIPKVADTGDLDSNLPDHGGSPNPECSTKPVFYGDCVYTVGPPLNYAMFGRSSSALNTSCYYPSDVDVPWIYGKCAAEEYPNGPSFFDRLDGSLNLSEVYVNQSIEYFGTSVIGLESFVNLSGMAARRATGWKLYVNDTFTWIDYLYWANKTGCVASAYCNADDYPVKVDCVHAYRYGLPTNCSTGVVSPNCGDGVCSVTESYRTCPKSAYYPSGECSCPKGCIQNATLEACSVGCAAPGTAKVSFEFTAYDCGNSPTDPSSLPVINVTYGPLASGVESSMNEHVTTGVYRYNTSCIDETYLINATAEDHSGSCLPIVKIKEFGPISGLTSC